jgi:DNA-binding transcriptional LysR family regulator
MDLNWIEDFRVLAEVRSFSRAARVRSISQSAFSKRIRSLENALGGELVVRNRQPLQLTPLGSQFLTDSGPILEHVRQARDNAMRLLETDRHDLTFCGATALAHSFYPPWITRKKAQLPGIVPQMVAQRSVDDDVRALEIGEVDFLLTYYHGRLPSVLDGAAIEHKVLGREELLPVCVPVPQSGAPLFDLDRPRPGPIPYVARLKGSYIGALVEALLAELRPPVVRAYAGTNGETLLGLLLEGNGIGWMPHDRIRTVLQQRALVRAGDTRWTIPVEVRLYRRLGRDRPIIEKFWSAISPDPEFPLR